MGSWRAEEKAEAAIPIEIGPTGAEADQDAACADDNFGGYLDEQTAPRAWLAFAQRVGLAAVAKVAPACSTDQRLGREVTGGCRVQRRGAWGRRRRGESPA